MSAIKVLMFGWELAPIMSGGLGVACRNLTDALSLKGAEITFVVPKLPIDISPEKFKLLNAANVEFDKKLLKKISVDCAICPYISTTLYDYEYSGKKFASSSELYGQNLIMEVERYALAAAELSRNIQTDIIHAHDWMTALAAIEAKKILKKPMIFHIHSTEYDRSANNPNPTILKYEKIALEKADKIIAVSKFTKNILIEKYSINPDKIFVVHNAIDNSKGSGIISEGFKSSHEKIVLFLARMSVQKGADYLLKAAKLVLSKKKNIKFVFVGNGPMLDELIEMSFDLGISDNVVFTGGLSHDQVDKAYSKADLFVMPSVSEPFGLTPLEAMKNGTPVLISKQSGVSEVIKNCLKVDFWNINDMASKILSILYNDTLSESLSSNGYRDLNQLTWSRQADKVLEVYQNIL